MMLLRDYQIEMLGQLERAWQRHRSVLIQMPTGTGKTVLMRNIPLQAFQKDGETGEILIVAHRRELIEQIKATMEGLSPTLHVTVESIQKLARAAADAPVFATNYTLIIIDEAHHAPAATYRMLWERWPEAKVLGLTATPCRLSGEPLTDLFDVLLQSWSIQTFIDKGWLSDFEYVSAAPDSWALQQVRRLKKRGVDGDYQTKEMVTVMDVPESISHLYATYRAFANGKKGIVYAIDRQHAQHIAEYYQQMGVDCAVIDAKTPADEREQLVDDYRQGRLKVLVNVDIFSEGFDCPEVAFIQLARPTLSLSKYLQQVGRGMRVSPGKPQVLILDNVGLYQTFGLPTDERDWQLTFSGKLSGKGQQQSRPVVVDLNELKNPQTTQKELVNLEMVRIKRRGEKHQGVEVILQDGLYGVMFDGKVTCEPRYGRVRPLQDGGEFFALADYPHSVLGGKTTVISNRGTDLHMALYGQVTRHGDFFEGRNSRGKQCFWDGIGREYYDHIPTFVNRGGLDLKPFTKGRFRLRRWPNFFVNGLSVDDIYANKNIAIIDNRVLIVKTAPQRAYTIHGYRSDSVLVNVQDGKQFLEIHKDGTVGDSMLRLPDGYYSQPNYGRMGLHAAK